MLLLSSETVAVRREMIHRAIMDAGWKLAAIATTFPNIFFPLEEDNLN